MDHSDPCPTPGTLPDDARIFPIRRGTKDRPLTAHGHLEAGPLGSYIDLGQNAGLALDGQFLLIDIDRPACLEAKRLERRLEEVPTWRQRARRGRHWLFRVPPGHAGSNVTLRDADGAQYGDAKVRGYVMTPGSEVGGHVYVCEDARDPVTAPDWLLAFILEARAAQPVERGEGRDDIPQGAQHTFAVSLAGLLRRHGLTAQAMESFTPALQSVFKDQRPGQPWVESDFKAIYRSAENWKTDLVAGDLEGGWLPEGWQAGAETPLVGPPERWWVPGFLPVGELTMVYGRGGAGKSTFASWLASEVSRAGGKIGVWGVEEPFRRFLRRAVLGGAVRENIFGNDHASTLELPRDAQAVASQARFLGLDVLYFDSIASHMDAASGLNIAERTRRSLAPLAELAQTEGFTVVCVFHENKAGEFGGSVEMLNVARHVLHLTRRGRGPLRVRVKKTNLEEPDFLLQFEADDLNIVDPQTGEVQMRVVDGEEQAATTKVLRAIDPLSLEAVEAEEEGTALVDVDRPLRGEALKTALRELLAASPGMHWQEAAQALNVNPQTVKRYIAECRPPAVGE